LKRAVGIRTVLYDLIPNMPDERLWPLIERYQETLSENRAFFDAFGVV
jgi:hypothetical protein